MNARRDSPTAYAALPLVYACSGCSSAAQIAHTLALRLDRRQQAEMSCIAGIGGDVKPLLRTARSQRPVIVLDGCPLHCARRCLERHTIAPDLHLDLSQHGITKQAHADPAPSDVEAMWEVLLAELPRLAMKKAGHRER